MGSWAVIELLARGVAVGALAAVAVGLARGGARGSVRLAGALFAVSALSYAFNSSGIVREALGPGRYPFWVMSLGGTGFFWLFAVTLFGDRPITPARLVPPGTLIAVGLAGIVLPPAISRWIWVVHNLIEAAFAIHAFVVIVRSWRGDLVEARRRLRGPFMAALTVYVIVLSGFEISEELALKPYVGGLVGAIALAVMSLLGAFVILEARSALFGADQPARVGGGDLDPADRATLARLSRSMDEQQLWRREGLTIRALAEAVGAPEHRLRRLINDRLGHRNFAAFVNAHRIEAAKAALADPDSSRASVATVAFDLGFGSLGPFNRAFKEATGLTPTAWRRRALEEASPIPANPG